MMIAPMMQYVFKIALCPREARIDEVLDPPRLCHKAPKTACIQPSRTLRRGGPTAKFLRSDMVGNTHMTSCGSTKWLTF
jgi:hypothetical protein